MASTAHCGGWLAGVQESRGALFHLSLSHLRLRCPEDWWCHVVPHMADANYDELWLHKQLPFLEDHDHSISFAELRPAVAAVSVADSRRLVVHLRGPTISCSFVVLHAPCRSQHNSIAEVEEWWASTTALLLDAELAPMSWIFIDANAPLASYAGDHFGDHGCERTNGQ